MRLLLIASLRDKIEKKNIHLVIYNMVCVRCKALKERTMPALVTVRNTHRVYHLKIGHVKCKPRSYNTN